MNISNHHIINDLSDNINLLIFKNEQLKKDKNDLNEELLHLKEELKKQKAYKDEIEEKYNILKIAKSLSTGDEDNAIVKKKINNLVREIDNCIALLNK